MNLFLRSLQFHLDDGLTVPLRKNFLEGPIRTPEWRDGETRLPHDSPVLYRADLERMPSVMAAFEFSGSRDSPIFVRALDDSDGNILGDIVETRVVPTEGRIAVQLEFSRAQLHVVGRHDDILRWQYRAAPQDSWQELLVTRHRIYVGLGLPTSPWDSASEATSPWTDVLDWACRWAAGAPT